MRNKKEKEISRGEIVSFPPSLRKFTQQDEDIRDKIQDFLE